MEVRIEGRYSSWAGKNVRTLLHDGLRLSGGVITRLKKLDDGIMLGGVRVTVRAVLHEGDILTLHTEDTASDTDPYLVASVDTFKIIWEDGDLVVAEKPSGMPTHPSQGHHTDSLASVAAAHYSPHGEVFVFRPVNRLDRDTSGLVLIARNRPSASVLSAMIARGEIEKRYIAILPGTPVPPEGRIELPIGRAAESIITRCVRPDGDEAVTLYRTLCCRDGMAALEVRPLTGRTHQIRVHFAAIGLPLLGDNLYGGDITRGISRQALHAYSLSFTHPFTGARLDVVSPLPPDMASLFPDLISACEALSER